MAPEGRENRSAADQKYGPDQVEQRDLARFFNYDHAKPAQTWQDTGRDQGASS